MVGVFVGIFGTMMVLGVYLGHQIDKLRRRVKHLENQLWQENMPVEDDIRRRTA